MNKFIIGVLLLLSLTSINKKLYAHFDPDVMLILFNSPLSYQGGYDLKASKYYNSLDINITAAYYNLGYNYNSFYGSTAFIGMGFTSIVQLQYGRNFSRKENLIRLRSDIPLCHISFDRKSAWRYLSVGLFWDYTFDNKDKSIAFGFSLSYNLASITQMNFDKKSK